MAQPRWLNVPAYFRGEQPLWRDFGVWSIGLCGTTGATVYFATRYFERTQMQDSWLPLIRVLSVWSILGLLSLVPIVSCRGNTKDQAFAFAAFAIIALPTAFFLFTIGVLCF